MRALIQISTAIVLLSILFISAGAQTSLSGKQDISALMKLAAENYDLKQEDAVILFEGKKLYWTEDGRLIDFVHRIIWINTDIAINSYGDHRIAYDSEHCDFHVATVRTWMDDRWWKTGETGIVPTTPHELELAYDYTNIQEMMLLHNGIELPCIIEVAYYIEDKKPFRTGIDGIWTFAKREPVIWSWFGYGVPSGTNPNIDAAQNLPAPEMEKDEQYNLDVYWWKAELLIKTQVCHIQDPTLDSPYIIYSTRDNWEELGKHISSRMEKATIFPEEISADFDSVLSDALTEIDSLNALAGYAGAKVRLINYDNSFWKYSPRTAEQVYSTAYGHQLDRTILVESLFTRAGFKADPVYISNYYRNYFSNLPTADIMPYIGLSVSKNDFIGYYSSNSNSVTIGTGGIDSRLTWTPGVDIKPSVINNENVSSDYLIRVIFEYDKDNDKFKGKGLIKTDNAFSTYGKIGGTGDKTRSFIKDAASAIIPEADIGNFNPLIFDESEIEFSFDYEVEKMEQDDLDRYNFTIGQPAGGIRNKLPDRLRLSGQTRDPGILFESIMCETVELSLNLKDIEPVYEPVTSKLNNDCGEFELIVTKDDDKLFIVRKLKLTKTEYKAADWDNLRSLLLEYNSAANNTLIFNAESSEVKKD